MNWGRVFPLSVLLIAWISWYFGHNWDERNVLVLVLINLWGIRLLLHTTFRSYGKLQISWLALLVCLPVVWVNLYSQLFESWTDYLGLALWLVGFFFEVVGDYQLFTFKNYAPNKNKILTAGLWRYTRHPNYFGEATMWWGIWFIAINASPNSLRFLTIFGPLIITWLLLRVSGVTFLEKKLEGSEDYIRYQKSTSPFLPWFPRNRFW